MRRHDRERYKFLQVMALKTQAFEREQEAFIEANFRDERKWEEFLSIMVRADRSQVKNPDELRFYDGYHALRQLSEDYDRFLENFDREYDLKMRELEMPPWIARHPVLAAHYTKCWNETVKPMFPISESIWVPRAEPGETRLFDSYVDQQLKDRSDPLKYLKSDEEGYAAKLKDWDADAKDEDRVQRAMAMGEALNRFADDIAENPGLLDYKEQILEGLEGMTQTEDKLTDGLVFVEELPVVLALNNSDPKRYNADFFAEYFQMDRRDFLTTVRRISWPIHNPKTLAMDKVLRYVDL